MAILRTVAALCFFAVVAHSLPSVSVAPETGLIQAKAAHADAAAKVQVLLQAGQTETECKTLAESTISDITASVASSQGILDALDKGYTCKDEGQADVTAAEQAKKEADDAAAAADEALTAATAAPVQLGPQAYNMLKTGDCGWIKTDPAFVAAHATYEAAVQTEAETNAAATAAAEALETAIAEAARLKAECECRVQKEHETAWAAATANNDANTQAWTQAQNMLCVLAHKESADCTFDPCPEVKKPVVDQAVLDADCAQEVAPVAHPNLLINGGFEDGWSQPWKQVGAGGSGLPGWTVESGTIDFGNYNTGGHCNGFTCANEGESFIDMCGSNSGVISQSVPTIPGQTYQLKLAYDAHATCTSSGTNMLMRIYMNTDTIDTLSHVNEGTWNLNWAHFEATYTATSESTTLKFSPGNNACGCMLVDGVELRQV